MHTTLIREKYYFGIIFYYLSEIKFIFNLRNFHQSLPECLPLDYRLVVPLINWTFANVAILVFSTVPRFNFKRL